MRPIPPEILGSGSLPRVRIYRLTPEFPYEGPRDPGTQGPDAARRWRLTARRRWCGLALGTGQSGIPRWSRCGRRCGTRAQEIDKGVQGGHLNLRGPLRLRGPLHSCRCSTSGPSAFKPRSSSPSSPTRRTGDWRLPRPRSGRRCGASCNPLAWLLADRLGSSWIRLIAPVTLD
jgi:hypothetical protein